MVKVAFTGGRDYNDIENLTEACKIVGGLAASLWGTSKNPESETLHIAVGDCPTGVDKFIRDFFKEGSQNEDIWIPHTLTVFVADWTTHKKAAGPIRNREMLTKFKPHVLIAFDGGKGTMNCIKEAKSLNIPVKKLIDKKTWKTL